MVNSKNGLKRSVTSNFFPFDYRRTTGSP